MLNDPKYTEICNGLKDKHNQLLDEFKTLISQIQLQRDSTDQSNAHNGQRLQEMQNKINQFENLKMFKQWHQADLGQLFYVELASLVQQRLEHILKQSETNNKNVNDYVPYAFATGGTSTGGHDNCKQLKASIECKSRTKLLSCTMYAYVHVVDIFGLIFVFAQVSTCLVCVLCL